jgi:hypothetical protein
MLPSSSLQLPCRALLKTVGKTLSCFSKTDHMFQWNAAVPTIARWASPDACDVPFTASYGGYARGTRRSGSVALASARAQAAQQERLCRRSRGATSCRHRSGSERRAGELTTFKGVRLKAYIVVRPEVADKALFLDELRDWIDHGLPAPERPKAVRIGVRLPVSASGKACDWNVDADEAEV